MEKATRVISDEEKALLETDFVGKNGQRRKLEVLFAMTAQKRLPWLADGYLIPLV